jgi:hypothetical protein
LARVILVFKLAAARDDAPMSKVMLRLRDLDTGEPKTHECESVEAACGWLAERPEGVEILGVVFEGLTREENDRMKQAMRPFSAEEALKVKALDDKEAAIKAERAEARRREMEADAARLRGEAKEASPDRPMEVRYRFDMPDLQKTDPLDQREITEEVKTAVAEWVTERTEWVASRGQMIGEAKVTLYPGAVPKGKERVVQGTFVPVTAPSKT